MCVCVYVSKRFSIPQDYLHSSMSWSRLQLVKKHVQYLKLFWRESHDSVCEFLGEMLGDISMIHKPFSIIYHDEKDLSYSVFKGPVLSREKRILSLACPSLDQVLSFLQLISLSMIDLCRLIIFFSLPIFTECNA